MQVLILIRKLYVNESRIQFYLKEKVIKSEYLMFEICKLLEQNNISYYQITYKAVITATRPMKEECVNEIYSFEILSSTEWNYPLSFSPNTFFDISETLDLKIRAMKEYQSELCIYPHPRSLKGIKLNAKYQGMRVGKKYVEAFKSIRIIK